MALSRWLRFTYALKTFPDILETVRTPSVDRNLCSSVRVGAKAVNTLGSFSRMICLFPLTKVKSLVLGTRIATLISLGMNCCSELSYVNFL